MLRFFIVKDILLLPVRYLIVFLATGLLIVGLAFMALWGGTYDPGSGSSTMSLAGLLYLAPAPAVLVAVYVAGMYLLFTLLKRKARRAAGIIVVTVTGFALLTAGGLLLADMPSYPQELTRPLPQSTIVNTPEYTVYAESRQGLQYGDVLLHQRAESPGFMLVREAVRQPEGSELVLPAQGIRVRIDQARNAPWRLLDMPALVSNLLADVLSYTRIWLETARSDLYRHLILTAASALFVASLWPLARVTRWPLFNALMVLGAVRLLFATAGLMENESFIQVFAELVSADAVVWILPVALAAVSLLFFALLALMQPFDQWRREFGAE